MTQKLNTENGFQDYIWKIDELNAFKKLSSPTMPFAVSLTELMQVKEKK
jgi:hypothetical protein